MAQYPLKSSNQEIPENSRKEKSNRFSPNRESLSRNDILNKLHELKNKSSNTSKKRYKGKPFPMSTAAFKTTPPKAITAMKLNSLLLKGGIKFNDRFNSKYENYFEE